MKQQAKNRLIQELPPAGWHKLDSDTLVMVSIRDCNDQRTTHATTLGDLKRYLLNEILEALENGERPVKAPPHVID